MRRTLHIVRTSLPGGVTESADLVVYIDDHQAPAPGNPLPYRIRSLDPHGRPQDRTINSRELCDLVFEFDHVVVW